MPIENFKHKATLFLIKFFLIYAILQTIILMAPLEPLQNSIAEFEAGLLGLEAEGNTIPVNSNRFEIVANCTGLMSISVLAAIIFSLRKPELKKKIMLFAAGAIILFPLNLLRVYLVIVTATTINPELAEILHTITWFTTSAIILAMWYYLTKRIAKVKDFPTLL